MINKQNKIIVGIIALILALTVGYAIFFKSLNINGTAKAKASFGLIFENSSKTPTCRGYSGGDDCTIEQVSSISEDGRTLTVTVDKLLYPTAYVKIPTLIKNTGTVDAILESMEITGLESDDIDVKYSITEEDIKNGYIVKPGNDNRKEVEIEVSWNKDSTYSSDTPLSITFNITMNYKQATNASITTTSSSSNTNNCTEFTKKDTYAVGNLIAFCNTDTNKSEDFYVIKDNGDTVTALAKYSLLVGNSLNFETGESSEIPTNVENYGLQSDKTIFYNSGSANEASYSSNLYYGNLIFAERNYWEDNDGNILSKYGSNYPIEVYDELSPLYTPINNYKNYLVDTLGKSSVSARLIKNSELLNLGCRITDSKQNSGDCTLAPDWVSSTLYASSTVEQGSVFLVLGRNAYAVIDQDTPVGVRPVITISKSEI